MELLSIVTARSIFLFEVDSLDPLGSRSAAEVVAELRSRYSFAVVPDSLNNIDNNKGAEFSSGRLKDIVIDKLTLFSNGIVVDTRSSTENAEAIANDLLEVSRETLGSRAIVGRKHFVSQITFKSTMQLSRMNPILSEISEQIKQSLGSSMHQEYLVDTVGVTVQVDETQARILPAKFVIARRADAAFFENIYFASAPLRTPLHLELVEKFEASLL
jgi:hypothetical protein